MGTPTKWGPEFLVNTTTAEDQTSPAIAALTGGRFVVTWTDDSGSGGDTTGYAVRAQMFNADGSKFGDEFLVNTVTAGEQYLPTVIALANGGFVISWETDSQATGDTSPTAISAQIFDATGGRVGGEFRVNTATEGSQFDVGGAALPNGKFVLSWSDFSETHDNSAAGIRAQLFNADGSPYGIEFAVNTTTVEGQVDSAVAVSNDGIIAMVWTDGSKTGSDTSGNAIRARLFNADGIAFGPDFVVNSTTQGDQAVPDIVALTNGNFLVTWQDLSQTGSDTSGYAIRAQVLKSDGNPLGSEFLVNTTTEDNQTRPTVTALPDGRFVVTWEHQAGLDGDVRAQVFNADGSKSGGEFTVNTETTGFQGQPAITVLADGRIAVAISDYSQELGDTSTYGIAAQIFDPREGRFELFGTTQDDQLIGTRFDDLLGGGIGNDRLRGEDGNDTLLGDLGADILDGGAGTDTVVYDDSPVGVIANLSGASFFGHAAGDTLLNIENLTGSVSGDILVGDDNANTLVGLAGADSLAGGDGNDRLIGDNDVGSITLHDDGDDVLDGGAGDDTMLGGGGNDTYMVDSAGDVVIEIAGEGIDTVNASISYWLGANVEDLVLTGTADLQGYGNAQANRLIGNSGANLLDGRAGADTMAGGIGNDVYVVDSLLDQVIENAGEGTADYVGTLVSGYTLAANVERGGIAITTGATLWGNGLDNILNGNSGNDTLYGGVGVDTLLGNGGDDVLDGGIGNDAMAGGIGNDVYVVDSVFDQVVENAGEGTADYVATLVSGYTLAANVERGGIAITTGATLRGNDLDNILNGNSGYDALYGGAGVDALLGNGGDDFLDGGTGNDAMAGGTGNDVYVVDSVFDQVVENAGEGTADYVATLVSGYTLAANVERGGIAITTGATLRGNDLDNILNGNSGNDTLYGGAGVDTLLGNGGDDFLDGGAGNDAMAGGAGNDVYVVDSLLDQVVENAGEGTADYVATLVSGYTLAANVERGAVALAGGGALTGNALNNILYGGAGGDTLDGGAGLDALFGNDGNDTFVFQAGQANGDAIADFVGNGAGVGDSLQFIGFGTQAQGATFTQLDATHWQIHSGLDAHNEVIALANGAAIHSSDFSFL